MDIWDTLYNAARKVQNDRAISPFIDAGGVAAALVTKAGNIYVGVCIDTAASLGMCAERNAIANMITNGESQIDKILAVMPQFPHIHMSYLRDHIVHLGINLRLN